ncbi:DUF2972 domain-containing protein [Campylobacter sp. 2014D-0216]|uniref:DUF2972 domain-containing protein n=1 Tax=Campylobacter sp. 2014D-0216 TaxID=1813595 RepID=UPI0018A57F4C|nr:DUF2972 domain-containing protein [Campylobacter sp. 2014D-0216]QOR00834.1 DUF2972 domain-containing protein [Campylobacter sp. 2014D-0216]
MGELSPSKAFKTLTKLANKYNFASPNINTKDLFNRKEFRGYIRYLLPLTFHVDHNVKLTIDRFYPNNEQYNIIEHFCNNDLVYDIGIYLDKKQHNYFFNHKNYNKIKKYLSNFLDDIKTVIDLTEDTMMKEEDVIYYLKKNTHARIKLKNILDVELSHIKQHRPDIVESWFHYQEFRKLIN